MRRAGANCARTPGASTSGVNFSPPSPQVRFRSSRNAAIRAALGALLLNTISSALYVLGISPFWNQAIFGFLLLLAITLDRFISVRLTAALRSRGARHE